MPLISRAFLKSGMICFTLSLISGILLQIDALNAQYLVPLFWHLLMLGWITQIIIGVSLWMFPGRRKDESVRKDLVIWLTFWLLNIGLGLRIISEPFIAISTNPVFKILLGLSAILQFLAAVGYIIEIWPRVISKEKMKRKRKRKKEA